MMQAQPAEWQEKWGRVRALLDEEGAQALLLNQRPGIAWFTGGADVHVARDEAGVAALLITAEKVLILTTEIEAARLEREEFAPVAGSPGWQIVARPWTRTLVEQLEATVSGRTVLTDDPVLAVSAAGSILWQYRPEKIAALRYPLTLSEVERYRLAGRLAGRALEEAARAVRRSQSELEISADLDRRLQERGLEPTVNLVAADERVGLFRHPIPTGTRVLSRCMLVTCARYCGLTVAATRLVHLGRLPADLERRHQAVLQVEAAMLAASRPGVTMAEVYQAAVQAYAAQGFPGEERLHHQGGTIGYRNRDYRVEPGSTLTIHAPQAVAWNPSITGTKTEDTFLVTESGLELLSAGGTGWPAINVDVNGVQIPRPAILEL